MSVPIQTNGVVATQVTAASITWSHTAEANKTIYAICFARSTAATVTTSTCTFGGVAMELQYQNYGIGAFHTSVLVYSLRNPTPGAANIIFTPPASAILNGGSFNIENGPVDGCIILPGMFVNNLDSMVKKCYAWDTDALAIAATYNINSAAAITEGTAVASNANIAIKRIDATGDTEQTFTATKGVGSADLTLVAFMIPSLDQVLSGGSYQPLYSFNADFSNMLVGASPIDCGLPYGTPYITGRTGDICLIPGTMRSIAAKVNAALGAGNEITAELVIGPGSNSINGVGRGLAIPTGISISIGGASDTEALLDGIDFSIYRYRRLVWRLTNTGAGTIPADRVIQITALVETDTNNEQVYGGGAMNFLNTGTVDVFADRAALHPANLNWGNFPNSEKCLVGIPGTITELLVNYQEDTLLDPDHEYYFELNGVLQDGTGATIDTKCTLVANSLGQALARSKFSLPVVAGDYIAVPGVIRDASSSDLRQSASYKFLPDNVGEFMLSGTATNTGSGNFNTLPNNCNGFDLEAEEYRASLITPPMTVTGTQINIGGARVNLEDAGPGVGKSWTIKLRKNLANTSPGMPDMVISGTDVEGLIGGEILLDTGDLLSLTWTAADSPYALRQFFTIPGIIESEVPTVGSITVIKSVPAGSTKIFDFNASGGLISPTSFQLSNGQSQLFASLAAGTYSIVEVTPAGWNDPVYVVSNGDPNTAIVIVGGEAITVTVVNSVITGEASGIYKLVPGKRNDTLWTTDFDEIVVKIPNPRFKLPI